MRRLRSWTASHLLLLAVVFYCLEGAAFVFFGAHNRDEGWSLYASRLVYHGQIPYRDFPYFQAPLLPYIYGLPQRLFGGGVLMGGFTSLALSLVTVGAGVHLASRAAGRVAALLFLLIIMLTLLAMWTFTTVRTESLVIPLAMLSLLFFLKEPKRAPALVLAPSLMLWAAATRLTVLPAFFAVFLFSLYRARDNRSQWGAVAGIVGLQAILLLVVPLVVAGHKALFDVWTSQVSRTDELSQTTTPLGAYLRDRALFFATFFDSYPVVAVLTSGVGVFLVPLWRRGWRPSVERMSEYPNIVFVALMFALLLFAPHLLLNPLHPLYFVTPLPFLLLAAAIAVVKVGRPSPSQPAASAVFSIVAGLLVIAGVEFAAHFPGTINTTDPERLRIREVGAYLHSVVPPDGQIVTFDPTLALESGRKLAPGLEMSSVSYWPFFDDEKAQRYGVINLSLLRGLVDDEKTNAVVLSGLDFVMIARGLPSTTPAASSSPPPSPTQEDGLFNLFPDARGHYRLEKVYPSYGLLGADLLVFLRTD